MARMTATRRLALVKAISEDNACIDCGRPTATYEDRCATCWQEIDSQSDLSPRGYLPHEIDLPSDMEAN